jgi:predicted GIY-YIG superfamily endonuclease
MWDKPTDLYRHYDADDRLLYVGISLDAFSRLRQHKGASGWTSDAVTMRTVRYPNRSEALEAESQAIIDEKPLWNIMGAESSEYREKETTRPMRQGKPRRAWFRSWDQEGSVDGALVAINTAANSLFSFRTPLERQKVATGNGRVSIQGRMVDGDTRNGVVTLMIPNGLTNIVSFSAAFDGEHTTAAWSFLSPDAIAREIGIGGERYAPKGDALAAFERALARHREQFEYFLRADAEAHSRVMTEVRAALNEMPPNFEDLSYEEEPEPPTPTHYAPTWAEWR